MLLTLNQTSLSKSATQLIALFSDSIQIYQTIIIVIMLILPKDSGWTPTIALAVNIRSLINKPLFHFSLLMNFFSTECLRLIMVKKQVNALSNQAK